MRASISKGLVPLTFAMLLLLGTAAQAQSARIEGQVVDADGHGVGNVVVSIDDLDEATTTTTNGHYELRNLPPGTYTLTFTLNENVESVADVVLSAGEVTRLDQEVAWNVSFADTMTVYSASRRQERIVDAPAAVTHISEEEVEREAAHGQLPKLLEFTPGAQVTQSGLYDFNFNTRGFNSSLNRRIVTLIDGRDPSVPFLGSQEWAAVSFPLDDLASMELVRGPSSALYGANAFNGVLNMVTKQPRYSEGGMLRVVAGELSSLNGDFRQAGEIGGGVYYKLNAGYRESEDFGVSRVGSPQAITQAEYGNTDHLLPAERIPLISTDNEIFFGGARLEKYFDTGHVGTLEGGYAEIEGPAFQTGIGRVQLTHVERPWARANYSTPHWNLLGYWNERQGDQRSLLSGAPLTLDSANWQVEAQGNVGFASDRGRLVAGASYGEEEIETFGTLTFSDVDADFTAAFAQVDFDLTNTLKLVLAGRYDESSLHDSQFSPKGSLVFALTPNQTLRLTYNEAFQVANYSEFFLQAQTAVQTPAGPISSLPLGFIDAAFGPLGFSNVPILALGNSDLEVEEIETWELGYTGVIANRTLLTLDYYNSTANNFISDLLPNLTPAGRLNPNFQFYSPPASLPAPARAALLQLLQGLAAQNPLFGFLSNNFDGSPIIALATYTNFGEVETQGVDLGLQWHISRPWTFNFNYSWFDFDVVEAPSPALEEQLKPNAPESSFSTGLLYAVERWDAGLNFRWVDGFEWTVGVFDGAVPSYEVVDLTANYRPTDLITIGVNVSNLLDDEHWEAFGGDVLGRRALGSVQFSW